MGAEIESDDLFPVRKYDKVLFHPKHAIPVDFESDNLLYVVPTEDVVAVFRKAHAPAPSLLEDLDGDSDFDESSTDDEEDI